MSEIRVGDLVMVVRSCCPAVAHFDEIVGKVFTVEHVAPPPGQCSLCWRMVECAGARGSNMGPGYISVSRLKKIEPLPESETMPASEEIPA